MNFKNYWRKENMYCVIVGDIINSKKIDLDAVDEVNNSIKDTLNYINTVYISSILADFGLVRGDAFEGILLTYDQIPDIINDIIKGFYHIRQTKVRICVVFGELISVSTDRNEANGPAFYQAIDAITRMKAEKSEHWFQVSILTSSYAQPLLDNVLNLISSVTQDWTDRQREIIWEVGELSDQQSLVSKKLGISPSVVNKQLKAAHYQAYRKAWEGIGEFLTGLEEKNLQEENSFLAYYGAARRKNKRHEYESAYQLLQKAKEIAEKELSEDDPQLVLIYNGLAENLLKAGDLDAAGNYIALSLQAQKNVPKSHLIYPATLNLSGSRYLEKNMFENAMEDYKAALEIARNTVGEQHYFTCACLYSLALALRREKKYREAVEYFQKVLSFFREHRRFNLIAYADALYYTAYCYFDMGDRVTSGEYAKESLKFLTEHLPPKHPQIKRTNELLEEIQSMEDNTHEN